MRHVSTILDQWQLFADMHDSGPLPEECCTKAAPSDHKPRDLTARYLPKRAAPAQKITSERTSYLIGQKIPHFIKLARLITCDVINGSRVRICPHVSNAHSLVPQANILMGRDICIPLLDLKPNISISFYKDFRLILSINSGISLNDQQPS